MQLFPTTFLFAFICVTSALNLEDLTGGLFNSYDETQTYCTCRLRSSGKIIGGKNAQKHSIPWQVSLALKRENQADDLFCGGVIVSATRILTAAHCVQTKTEDSIKVRVGMHNLGGNFFGMHLGESIQVHLVDTIIPNYLTTADKEGDIAVLKLKTRINFIQGTNEPACLNLEKKSYESQNLMASGWGFTKTLIKNKTTGQMIGGDYSPKLKLAYFQEDTENCDNFSICINSKNGDSICKYDSGGPLHSEPVNGRIAVEGVGSFVNVGEFVDDEAVVCNGSAGFSRLSHYKDWLKIILRNNFCDANAKHPKLIDWSDFD